MSEARGSNLHHIRKFVLEQYGRRGWAEVLGVLGPTDASRVRRVLVMSWFPLELQYRVLRTVDEVLGQGDGGVVKAIGRYEAEQDLTVVHRLFLRMANPGFVLEQAGRYWRRFYTSGRWEVERDASDRARVLLIGLEPFDPLMADYLMAYILRMWELMGVEIREAHSSVRNGTIVFEGSWN